MRLTRTLLVALLISLGLVGACGDNAGTEDSESEPAVAEDTSATEDDAAQGEQPQADTAADVTAEVEDANGPDDTETPAEGLQGLVINEIVAAAADGGSDWIELYVIGDQAVTLSDYTLVDDNPDHTPVTLPEVVVEPGEFFVLMAVDDGGPAVPSVPWKLGGDDGVWLARDGETIDSLDWEEGDTPEGTSWGRLPDGAADIALLTPTPGAPNVAWEGDKPEVPVEPDDCDLFPSDHVLSIQVALSDSDWQALLASPASETYYEANVTIDGVTTEQIAVRTKGNSSLNSVANNPNSDRYSWKLDMNRYVDGQKLCGLKKFNLNNGFKDPSMLREHIGYALATDIGLPAPRTSFADVTVNGQHLGLYTLVEHVDSEFIERWFDDDEGDLYKPDWPDGHLQWQGDVFTDYDGVELQSNEETSDYSTFMALLEVINGEADVTTVLDVDMMLRYLALNSLLVNLDSYSGNGHNYYVYEVDGVFTPIPWDLNEAFGNFTCGCSRAGIIGLLIDDPTCDALATKPMAERVLTDPTSVAQYHAHLAEFIAEGGPFSDAVIAANIEAAATLIRPYVEADTEKFFSTQDFETAIHSDVGNAIGLTTFVTERRAAIAAQLDGSTASSSNGEGSCGNGVPGGGGPGGGGPGGGGQNPKCPDGICDGFEQANPDVCPEDCE